MSIRPRIQPQLTEWYDNSPGFDFDHLDEFVKKCNAAEIANLKEDPEVSAYDRMIPGLPGSPDVKIRIYEPSQRKNEKLPVVFFYHGGGFLFGSVYRQENLCQRYVKNVTCIVISVEYRMAPQWKSPAALDDCYAALEWLYHNADEIGADHSRIAVSGLSAGGNLAAAICLMARDLKGPRIRLQIPLYAELDCRLNTPSSFEIIDKKVWCRDNCEKSWRYYLPKEREPNQYDSPSLADDLSNLPPLFSFIGQLDPGRDENIAYWTRLMQAGVEVEYHVFPGCYHCFELSVPESDAAKEAYRMTYAALKKAFI